MKIVKSLEESGLLRKAASKTNENEAKKQKRWNSWYVISCFFGNYLEGNEAHALDGVIRANERTIMVEINFWCHLILWLNLKDKDIIKINPRFNGVYFKEWLTWKNKLGIYDKSWRVQINRKSLDSFSYG